MNDEAWSYIDRHNPPDGELVDTKIDDEHGPRNHQELIRQGRLWFTPDRSMYVYYTPTHYRAARGNA